MAYPILLCGRICSGKSTLAAQLSREVPAVVLSCDALLFAMGLDHTGAQHDEFARRGRDFLMGQALDILRCGSCAVIDFGFWTHASRVESDAFFRARGYTARWRYLAPSAAAWERNLRARSQDVAAGAPAFSADEGLLRKLDSLFEEPTPEELADWAARED